MHTSPLCPKGSHLVGLIQLKVNSNLKTIFIAFNNSQTLLMPSTTFVQASLAKKTNLCKRSIELRFTAFCDTHAFSWCHRKKDTYKVFGSIENQIHDFNQWVIKAK